MALEVKLNNEDISIDTEPDFIINEDNVDGELCKAGRLLCFYGNLAADLKAQAVSFKIELESRDAHKAISIRNEGIKITEGGIKERILTDPDRKPYLEKLVEAERDYQRIENLYRSQQKKVDCVIALAYKQRTEIAKTHY